MRWILILFLVGCVSRPSRPLVKICFADPFHNQALCADAKNPDLLELENLTPIPIEQLDHAFVIQATEWEKIRTYIHHLEHCLEVDCR